MSRLITTRLISLAVGLGLSLSLATAASATCHAASEFTLRQKDGFTVKFFTTGPSGGTAFTKKYGSANTSVTANKSGTRWTYNVYWAHGEVGVYTITVQEDNFGNGTVSTPGRNVRPVNFTSINPVVKGC
jgi:hypothetical protein